MVGKAKAAADESPNARPDGRRERSRSSHKRIVEAMMGLIEGGDLSPSAARVAEEAGVGLRTVFRHFDDMDALYREISKIVGERIWPVISEAYRGDDWRIKLRDLTRRRARVFEMMLPFRLAANIKRYQSPFLMAEYGRVITVERELVLRLLPDAVAADRIASEALCAALSFQTWRAMRHDQGLPAEEAGTVMAHMVDALLAVAPAGQDR